MLIKKSDVTELSEGIRSAINGKSVDFRDNKEGAWSILKNDINTLVNMKNEQTNLAQKERDILTEYLANISHQLKTPITSMKIMADLVEMAPPQKQAEFMKSIKISLSRMEWLVATLLKMARLDSGVIEFSIVSIKAKELVKKALQPLEILLDVKNQTVDVVNDVELMCDQRWTAEALTNLIKNASEYSPVNGKITIDCGINPIYRWISVTDSGTGLKKENFAGIFERFSYSQNEDGYGIGLPLAQSIIRHQNGDIDIDGGGKGKGATFIIKFFTS